MQAYYLPSELPGKPIQFYIKYYLHQTQYSTCGSASEVIHLQSGTPGFYPWVGKRPWRRERLPTTAFWCGEFHGLYSPWGCKGLDTTEQLLLSLQYYIDKFGTRQNEAIAIGSILKVLENNMLTLKVTNL